MVSTKLFQSSPPFPDDVPVAQLPTVSLAGLSSGNEQVIESMFQACQRLGFFLLDLKDDVMGEQMIGELEKIFAVIAQTMNVSEEDKEKYHANPPATFWGYICSHSLNRDVSWVTNLISFKREGFMKTETGQRDRCTFFALLQDDLLGNIPQVDVPEPVHAARALLKSYVQHGQHVLSVILDGLEKQLGLQPRTLRDLQPSDAKSGTILRMIRGTPSVKPDEIRTGLLPHTDFGSVTLLANVLGGLQVLKHGAEGNSSNDDDWQWVKPQPGCLIVHMGDAMVEWTGGVLRSNLHRVNFAPGEQRFAERYASAMLIRARGDAKMERIAAGRIPRLEGDQREGIDASGVGMTGLSASEWETKKSAMLPAGKDIARSRGGRALRTAAVS